MNKLEDILGKKKTVVTVLDLSKSIVQSKEEFKRLMEKVPDYKMRPIKVRSEEIKLKEKDFSFKTPRKEVRKLLKHNGERDALYTYADPVPAEMRDVVLPELCAVPIDWKMLTTLRPKTKLEEDYFGRLVEMGKLQLKTEARDKREYTLNNGVKKVKNKSGVIETRLLTCSECGEELCYGRACTDFNYDLFVRVALKPPKPRPPPNNTANKGKSILRNGGGGRKKSAAAGSGKQKNRKQSPGKRIPMATSVTMPMPTTMMAAGEA